MNPFPVVLSAPSGGGKTTVTKLLMGRRAGLGYSVSCTTRMPRPGEVDGVDYHFLTDEEFLERHDKGEFAESALVHGKRYGTLKSSVQAVLDAGHHVMMDIDVQGAAQFAAAYPHAVLVFLLPPSVDVLVERLMARQTEDRQALLTRLKSAHMELHEVDRYHYVVVNDELEAAVERVGAIIDAEERKRERVRGLDAQLAGLIGRLEQEIQSFTKP
ncbi:MAG: guanylate kinase [Gemmatimonadetes bacterium]|nr:guanylate kinase [Gemmatimonadota bacterium]MBI3566783.1 guanylate kinase [Gemmatimonadota bacterium]